MANFSIAGSEINFTYSALEIFVSGCTHGCKGCQNPELQKFGVGKAWPRWLREKSFDIFQGLSLLIDKIWIVGGDLLCQETGDAVEFLRTLRKTNPKLQIVVWTGMETIQEVPDEIWKLVDGVKLGSYIKGRKSYEADYLDPKLGDTTVKLASDNQYFVMKGISDEAEDTAGCSIN